MLKERIENLKAQVVDHLQQMENDNNTISLYKGDVRQINKILVIAENLESGLAPDTMAKLNEALRDKEAIIEQYQNFVSQHKLDIKELEKKIKELEKMEQKVNKLLEDYEKPVE